MFKNNGQLFTGLFIGLVLGIFAGRQFFSSSHNTINQGSIVKKDSQPGAETVSPAATSDEQHVVRIPQKVYDVLKYIKDHHQAMPGYVGGRIFSNREELLPREDNKGKPVLYHEWDVNPKIDGQNRGTERIITGTDGRAWYTNDHYHSFRQIK